MQQNKSTPLPPRLQAFLNSLEANQALETAQQSIDSSEEESLGLNTLQVTDEPAPIQRPQQQGLHPRAKRPRSPQMSSSEDDIPIQKKVHQKKSQADARGVASPDAAMIPSPASPHQEKIWVPLHATAKLPVSAQLIKIIDGYTALTGKALCDTLHTFAQSAAQPSDYIELVRNRPLQNDNLRDAMDNCHLVNGKAEWSIFQFMLACIALKYTCQR